LFHHLGYIQYRNRNAIYESLVCKVLCVIAHLVSSYYLSNHQLTKPAITKLGIKTIASMIKILLMTYHISPPPFLISWDIFVINTKLAYCRLFRLHDISLADL